MKSQIDFVDSQTLKPKPEVDAGRILVSSKNLEWEGIYIEKGENKQFNPDDVTVPQHYFAMNIGPAFEWEWKDGQTFKTHRYETGDVWINPAGVPFSHRIKTHNQFVLLTLEPAKVIDALPDYPLIDRQVFRRVHRSKDKHLQTLMQALLVEAESGGPNGRFYADTLSNRPFGPPLSVLCRYVIYRISSTFCQSLQHENSRRIDSSYGDRTPTFGSRS